MEERSVSLEALNYRENVDDVVHVRGR